MTRSHPIPRRAFLAGAGAALLATPAEVRAQQRKTLPTLAIVSLTRTPAELLPNGHPWFQAFYDELRKFNLREGESLNITRWSGRNLADRRQFANEIVASSPDVIFAAGGAQIAPCLIEETKLTPIIYLGQDPEAVGLVKSIARPGGNLTGFSTNAGPELNGKLLQLLVQTVSSAKRIAALAPSWSWEINAPYLRAAAEQLQVALQPIIVDPPFNRDAYSLSFSKLNESNANGVVVGRSAENIANVATIAALCQTSRVPGIQYSRAFAEAGGLLGYDPNYAEIYRQAATYVLRILNGEKPGNLPIQLPTKFDFIVNNRTARSLGIEIPLGIQAFVSEWIE